MVATPQRPGWWPDDLAARYDGWHWPSLAARCRRCGTVVERLVPHMDERAVVPCGRDLRGEPSRMLAAIPSDDGMVYRVKMCCPRRRCAHVHTVRMDRLVDEFIRAVQAGVRSFTLP